MMNHQIKKTFISQQLIKILNRAFPWLQKACTYVDAKQRRFVNVTVFPYGLLHGWKTEGIGE